MSSITDDDLKRLLSHPAIGAQLRAFLEGTHTALVARKELVGLAIDALTVITAIDELGAAGIAQIASDAVRIDAASPIAPLVQDTTVKP